MKTINNLFLNQSVVKTLGLLPLALFAVGCGGGNGSPPASRVIYTQTNAVNGNSVVAYRQAADGRLAVIGTYATGGNGVREPRLAPTGVLDTDRSVIVNTQHNRLYTVNQGSDTISVFNINSDGSLTQIGSPINSGGPSPVSLSLIRNDGTLLVLNSGLANDATHVAGNYTSFSVASNGTLTPITNSNVPIPLLGNGTSAGPSIVLPSPDNNLVFDGHFLGDRIAALRVDNNGVLSQVPGSPFVPDNNIFSGITNPNRHTFGLGVHPTQNVLYVSFPLAQRIATYTYDTTGQITFVRSFSNPGRGGCWIINNRSGNRMYVTNAITGNVTVFDTSDVQNPTLLQDFPLTGTGQTNAAGNPIVNGNPWHLSFDAQQTFLYVLAPRDLANTPEGQGNTIHVMRILANGTLEEVPNSTVPVPAPANLAGEGPDNVIFNPQGLASI